MKQRILVVEDDAVLARALRDTLTFEGFEVETVADGGSALRLANRFAADLVVLDLMLPGTSGFELCRALRDGPRRGIIILTAKAQKNDKLRGLSLGADDYITKPFDLEELLARVRAVLRRTCRSVECLSLGTVTVDFRLMQAWHHGRRLELSHREFEILHYLAEHQDSVVHRDELLRVVWGYKELPFTRSVDHAIARLRRTIEPDPHHPTFVHTVHGDGYQLTPDATAHVDGQSSLD